MAKIKIDGSLFNRAEKVSQAAGYSSVEEFIIHLLEKELEKVESTGDGQMIEKQLRGLGYIE